MKDKILIMKFISKNFGGIQALENVDFNLNRGEINCLVGENGAGKSTLMNILAGVIQPTQGRIFINEKEVEISHPKVAHNYGISIVYQELSQFLNMKVSENIYMGRYPKKNGAIDFQKLEEKTNSLLKSLGIKINPNAYLHSLSVAQRQLIEIAKAVSFDSKIIIFDEPTSSLSNEEVDTLFKIILDLKKKGVSIIYISHKLEECFYLGDEITVLKDGKLSGNGRVDNLDMNKVISMMVGRDIKDRFPKSENEIGEEILEVKNITNENIKDISFKLNKGEVLGLGGMVGSGRTEVARAIFGLDNFKGEIYKNKNKINQKNPKEAIENGFVFVPEDRRGQGLVMIRSLLHNVELSSLNSLSKLGIINSKKEINKVDQYIEQLNIKASSENQTVNTLSGGNQQKVVIAKSLMTSPEILILDEPTRGIDVGSKREIYELINKLKSKKMSIIMISSELPELINMSDRIIVMSEGEITGQLKGKEKTEENVMKLATKRTGENI